MLLTTTVPPVLRARNAVAIVFAANGFAFASWIARVPESRDALGLTPGGLGALLLAISVGSLIALPAAGSLIHRFGAATVVTVGSVVDAAGLAVAGLGAGTSASVWLAAVGLFALGFGSGSWDVAMNVEGAAVERDLGRTVMPRFHAAFSLGTVLGAGLGAAAAAARLPVTVHLLAAALLVAVVAVRAARAFLPASDEEAVEPQGKQSSTMRAWLEPRTLVIGVMVLAMALTEGTANDWLAVALVDGYDVPEWVGAAGFAAFVTAMTTGRMIGPVALDRYGRTRVLWSTMALAGAGVLIVVFGTWPPLVVVGILLWGLGASLGFPVGMSAAADDPEHAAARVSVVSTIGYTAFLAGPPLLGFLGDHIGTLRALLVVAVLLIPSALAVTAARAPQTRESRAGTR